MSNVPIKKRSTVGPRYNIHHYNMKLDITWSDIGPQFVGSTTGCSPCYPPDQQCSVLLRGSPITQSMDCGPQSPHYNRRGCYICLCLFLSGGKQIYRCTNYGNLLDDFQSCLFFDWFQDATVVFHCSLYWVACEKAGIYSSCRGTYILLDCWYNMELMLIIVFLR